MSMVLLFSNATYHVLRKIFRWTSSSAVCTTETRCAIVARTQTGLFSFVPYIHIHTWNALFFFSSSWHTVTFHRAFIRVRNSHMGTSCTVRQQYTLPHYRKHLERWQRYARSKGESLESRKGKSMGSDRGKSHAARPTSRNSRNSGFVIKKTSVPAGGMNFPGLTRELEGCQIYLCCSSNYDYVSVSS